PSSPASASTAAARCRWASKWKPCWKTSRAGKPAWRRASWSCADAGPAGSGRNHCGDLDLDLGAVFDKVCHLHRRHGREMPADDLPVVLADFGIRRHIFLLVGHVPGHAHNVFGTRAAFGENGHDVLQRLAHLARKVVGFELLVAVPAHLSAYEQQAVRSEERRVGKEGRCWGGALLDETK